MEIIKGIYKEVWTIEIVLLLIAVASSGCIEKSLIEGTGTVKYIDLEGGFYGIVSDVNFHGYSHLEPINLPNEFKEDGLRVKFKARVLWNQVSFHMWGLIVKILEIERIE